MNGDNRVEMCVGIVLKIHSYFVRMHVFYKNFFHPGLKFPSRFQYESFLKTFLA